MTTLTRYLGKLLYGKEPEGKSSPKMKARLIAPRSKKRQPTKFRTDFGWRFPDGREVCDLAKSAGKEEYGFRIAEMVDRQLGFCKCGKYLVVRKNSENGIFQRSALATFGHDEPRRMGGGFRDDRIWDENGKPMNHAECWECNSKKGSKRIHEGEKPIKVTKKEGERSEQRMD